MIMVEYWKLVVLQRYAKFEGRAGRAEFWWFALANFIVGVALNVIGAIVSIDFVIAGLYSLAVLIPSLAVGVRRLHDTGKTGWLLLLSIIPLVGTIILIVFFVQEGNPGANEYGLPDPGLPAA